MKITLFDNTLIRSACLENLQVRVTNSTDLIKLSHMEIHFSSHHFRVTAHSYEFPLFSTKKQIFRICSSFAQLVVYKLSS